MKKRLDREDLIATQGPMNQVATDDAKAYLGLEGRTYLTPIEEKQIRAKKKKIVTQTKKLDRKVSREITRRADRLD